MAPRNPAVIDHQGRSPATADCAKGVLASQPHGRVDFGEQLVNAWGVIKKRVGRVNSSTVLFEANFRGNYVESWVAERREGRSRFIMR